MYDLLKLKNKGLKTPLANARRFGSAHEGLHHWIVQRTTALASLVLLIWFIVSTLPLLNDGYAGFLYFLADPLNAMLMGAFVAANYLHAYLGLQVVIEDYVHCDAAKITSMLLLKALYWAGLIVSLFSIAKIAIGFA